MDSMETITLRQQQLQRWHVLKLVLEGRVTLREAAARLGLSYRQAKRLKRAVKAHGARGILHGNAGRRPPSALPAALRDRILDLAQTTYADCNDTHCTELLTTREGFHLSRETLRSWRRAAGQAPKRRRRPRRHYRRRPRKAQAGLLMLWDGSPHPWFGPAQPPCCLLAAIEDATGEWLYGRFEPAESSAAYLHALRTICDTYGLPVAVYQDRHGALHRNDAHWTLAEQLAGQQAPTQVGHALATLGIQAIFALSPQAKGRIERLFGTLQDRLTAELALAGLTTPAAGNAFVATYRPAYNARFAVPPADTQTAWRPVPRTLDLARAVSFLYTATVGADNAVRLGGLTIDISPGPRGRAYAKARVEVRQLLDGTWRVYLGDACLATHPATPLRDPAHPLKVGRPTPSRPSDAAVYLASAPHPGGHNPSAVKGTY